MKKVNITQVLSSTPLVTEIAYQKGTVAYHKMRLRKVIMDNIDKRGWTNVEAGEYFGVHNSRISTLRCGKIEKFSIDYMLKMLSSLGYRSSVEVEF